MVSKPEPSGHVNGKTINNIYVHIFIFKICVYSYIYMIYGKTINLYKPSTNGDFCSNGQLKLSITTGW